MYRDYYLESAQFMEQENINLPLSLQFKYRSLQHEYAALQNQFSLFSQQTNKKIKSLQQEMDSLLFEKQRQLKTVTLQKKNVQMSMKETQKEMISMQQNEDILKKQIENERLKMKQKQFKATQTQKYLKQILLKVQTQLAMKSQQNQTLKQVLNNERIINSQKQQGIRTKQNQISRLNAEVLSLNKELDAQVLVEERIKDTNYKLKKQVQELKTMFVEMESSINNCNNCGVLKHQNMELRSKLKFKVRQDDSARNQKLKRNLSIHNPTDYQTINKESIDSSAGKNYYFRDRKTRKRQLKQIDVNLTVGRWQNKSIQKMRDSIFNRCKSIIDS